MDASIRKERRYIKARLSRIESFTRELDPDSEIDPEEISVRLERLERVIQEFSEIHKRLITSADGQGLSEADEIEEIEFEERYITCKVKLSSFLRQVRATPLSLATEQQSQVNETPASNLNGNSVPLSRVLEQQVELLRQISNNASGSNRETSRDTTNRESQVKLPVIKLPTFDGRFEDWQQFSDTFQTLIHNNAELSNIQKYQYLITTLQGNAARVIEAIKITSNNYNVAWDLLKNRFEDPVSIKKKHIQCLFEMPKVEKESAHAIRELVDHTQKHLRVLKSMSLPTESWDELIIHMLETNLDSVTRRSWEQEKREDSTLKDMTTFLQKRCQMLERINTSSSQEAISNKHNIKQGKNSESKVRTIHGEKSKTSCNKINSFATVAKPGKCFLCQGPHFIYLCTKFLSMSAEERINEVKRLRLCHNCLRNDHFVKTCKMGSCRECSGKHNTLCHRSKDDPVQDSSSSTPIEESAQISKMSTESTTQVNVTVHTATNLRQRILLATAVINVVHANGSLVSCRALLDGASEASFITTAMCNKLGLKPHRISESISGLDNMRSQISQGCMVTLKSRNSDFLANIHCCVVRRVSNDLPSVSVDPNQLQIPNTIKLADSQYYLTGKIDMLLGAELFYKILKPGQIELGDGSPILQNTSFGWIIGGSIPQTITSMSITQNSLSVFNCSIDQYESLNDNLKQECEDIFVKTVTRDESGRFSVRLPFRDNVDKLGDSREIALKRFDSLERRLKNNKTLHAKYSEFMREYIALGHMSPVPDGDQESKPIVYLPHHGVFKDSSATTKIRVVFDASAKTSSGVSLNDTLLVGPTIQDELFDIIIRFRFPQIVLKADIQKMYRQILVYDNDRDWQRILWRFSQEDRIQEYRLNTVTYGQACAPYLAIRCVIQAAVEGKNEYPLASRAILHDLYVDDLLTDVDNLEEAMALQEQLQEMLSAHGFVLHKWSSNNTDALMGVPEHLREVQSLININESDTIRTLDLEWQPTTDDFRFSVRFKRQAMTKREILSGISRLFDPLGLLSPITIRAKLLMQQTWILNISWDDTLPKEIQEKWRHYTQDLEKLQTLRIPRRVLNLKDSLSVNLLGFCDASEHAYGACIYTQTKVHDGSIKASLLCSKSKIAPVKKTSLPRLELCGAVLLARLIHRIQEAMIIPIKRIKAFTDSTVVLDWINGDAARWKTFVVNRVTEIQSILSAEHWHHISGDQNPADLISRGTTFDKFKDHELWWNGPKTTIINDHPSNSSKQLPEEHESITLELKSSIHVHSSQKVEGTKIKELIRPSSSLFKTETIFAYILRFVGNCRKSRSERTQSSLTTNEIQTARNCLIKEVQSEHFHEIIHELQQGKSLSPTSKLITLSPFVDSAGLLRVGGRLQLSNIRIERKHPILLPANSWFTKQLFEQEHKRLLHIGPQTLLASIRLHYWPLRGRDLARTTVHQCVSCFKSQPKKLAQLMGSLPKERVAPSRPFFVTGVDFAGPITTLVNKGRGRKTNKSYIALFVCFSTKAIHLELTSELTAEAFLATLRRFIGRRGCPQKIFSDNATNFVRVQRDIKDLFQFIQRTVTGSLQGVLHQHGIQWNFIPPGSPHMGGLWEAGIKSCKVHLKRTMQNALLTFEELVTVLAQIEACLNLRPLCPLSADPSDLLPLTPGHFLIGEPITSIPDADLTEIRFNRLSRWQVIQRVTQDFWKRWSLEYLSSMQGRVKWSQTKENLKINDLVLIQDETLPPLKWKIGRVIQLHCGHDKMIRVVTVRTATGTLKRSITKLCKLPIND